MLQFDVDLGELAIKGKTSRGNMVTKNEVHRISLKERGASTLGDREVWFDPDILRINYEGHGRSLGLFGGDDRILVIMRNGEFYTTTSEATNHYDEGILRIEKYVEGKVWTAIVDDADQGYLYIKRCTLEDNNKRQRMIGENPASRLLHLSDEPLPRFEVRFGGADAVREPLIIDAEEFIGAKSFKAKGKRISNYTIESVTEIEPRELPQPELPDPDTSDASDDSAPDGGTSSPQGISQQQVLDRLTGQQRLFDD